MEVDTSLSRERVARTLNRIGGRGWPQKIVVDNGPEFRGRILDRWAYETGVRLHVMEPGKPMQNGLVEGFNSTFRDQCLNGHWYTSIDDAREKAEQWRQIYNTIKPHSSLGRKTPAEFAALCSGRAARIPFEPSRLGSRMHRRAPCGHGGSVVACGPQPSGSGLCPLGSLRASAHLDGAVVGVLGRESETGRCAKIITCHNTMSPPETGGLNH